MKSRIFTFSFLVLILLLFLPENSEAQFFRASIVKENNDIVFNVEPNPGGGNITASWIDIEFFLRLPLAEASGFNFTTITVNTTDFPGVSIPFNGIDVNGTEASYRNYWFGTSFSATSSITYVDGQEYELFRVTLDIDPASKTFELVHNATSFVTYFTMTNSSGVDLTPSSGVKFYGSNPRICTTCPAGSTNHITDLGLAPLPVELLAFDVQLNDDNYSIINWTTASEINSSHFEVEKSKDGISWEKITEVQAASYSNERRFYHHEDDLSESITYSGQHVYYRLKMVDLDQSFDYSEIEVVQLKGESKHFASWKLFPNPVLSNQDAQLRYLGKSIVADQQVRIYNLQGQLIWEKIVGALSTNELIEIPALKVQGFYLVEWKTLDGEVWMERLVVQ